MDKAQPNLLFVFSDQHRYRDLGCYGHKEVQSPFLDEFASKSVRFTHCVSNAPLCVPMRASMLTGKWPTAHGAETNDFYIKYDLESIADVLNAAGYATGYIGKWHLAGIPREQYIPEEKRLGFRYWRAAECNHDYFNDYYDDNENSRHPIEGYDTIKQVDLTLEFIDKNKGKPWAAVLSWGPPHGPYNSPPADRALYDAAALQLDPNVRFPVEVLPGIDMDEPQLREDIAGYYGHITALDREFGRLMDALKAADQWDNTIIVYTSDHGNMLGSQGASDKQYAYDESLLVPLIVHWEGHTWQGTSHEMISLLDLPASLLGLMGLRFSQPVESLDLSELFINPEAPGPEASVACNVIPVCFAFNKNSEAWRAVRTKRYTYCRAYSDTIDPEEQSFLFDNDEDPWQMDNLLNDPSASELRQEMEALLQSELKRCGDEEPRDWRAYLRSNGLVQKWNESELYLNLPLLDG